MLRPEGIVDATLSGAGIGGVIQDWLGDGSIVMLTLFVIISWKYFGFHMIILLAGLQGIPHEIEEAALMDGCTPLQLLRTVMLRLVSPGVVTVGLFAFFASWNELLAALIFQTDAEKFTLPVMLLNARSGSLGSINWGVMQAGISVGMLPCAILFLLMQRYYISGLIAGAVKA